MNILDKLHQVLGSIQNIKLGYLPDEPDNLSVLTEYSGSPPVHSFGGTDFAANVQLRSRGENSYETISSLAETLNGYADEEISVIQVSSVLDIGRDNKGRQEYTCNFKIIRY